MRPSRQSNKSEIADFIDEATINRILTNMEQDDLLNTAPSYVRDATNTVHLMSFAEKHASYLKCHPKVNPQNYLANVKTMIRIRLS
jgi:hypothetical protein